MKTTRIHLALALLTGITAAQEPKKQQDNRPPPIPPILATFDMDGDGTISPDEIKNASVSLAKLDLDGDGHITRDELRPPRPPRPPAPKSGDGSVGERPPGHRPPPPLIAALDSDRDGTLSAGELTAAPQALLELDENADGELSPEELHPDGPPPPPAEGPDR